MSKTVYSSNILCVFLSSKANAHQHDLYKKYHCLNLDSYKGKRQTYLSLVLAHSQFLIAEHQLAELDVVFIGSTKNSKTHMGAIQSHLNQSQFICRAGYCVTGKMGMYYHAGNLLTHVDKEKQHAANVSVPFVDGCAFRVYKHSSSKFEVYDKWNSAKYLDLELAFYAKECGQSFKLIEATHSDGDLLPPQSVVDKTHKAAIYNELFIKNCFDINNIHYSSSYDASECRGQVAQANEILNAHLSEIKRSNRKLDYVTSKIGNYDHLRYGIQSNVNSKRAIQDLFSVFKRKPDDFVTFSLASIPEREFFLSQTIKSIYSQCDQIYVYLNGYEEVPEFLNQPKIKTFRSQDHGDLSANGKVWFLNQEEIRGYVFLIDDDIIYPKDYVRSMVETLQKYQHKFAACVHGSIFSDDLRWYYQRSAMFPFRRPLIHDAVVNLPGSGTFAFHTDTLDVSYDDFAPFTMVDLILGILCKQQSVPIVSVARNYEWLKVQKDKSGRDLWSAFKSVITLHTPTALANGPWDFSTTKSYVLPKIEAVFGVLTSQVIEDNKLDKQFLHSAYNITIPELWSYAGRMQLATEKNYQEFLFRISNDDLDKAMDSAIYDTSIDTIKSNMTRLGAINQTLSLLMSECEIESNKHAKDLTALSKIQLNLKYAKARLARMDKTNSGFLAKKKTLSKLIKNTTN